MVSARQVLRHGRTLRGEREQHLRRHPVRLRCSRTGRRRACSPRSRTPPHPGRTGIEPVAAQARPEHVLRVVGEQQALPRARRRRHDGLERHRSQAVQEAAAGQGARCGVREAWRSLPRRRRRSRPCCPRCSTTGSARDPRPRRRGSPAAPARRARAGSASPSSTVPGQAEVRRALRALRGELEQLVEACGRAPGRGTGPRCRGARRSRRATGWRQVVRTHPRFEASLEHAGEVVVEQVAAVRVAGKLLRSARSGTAPGIR